MPMNAEDNQSQNWRELDNTLDNLTISLRPFVKRELRNKFGQNWEDKVSRIADHQPNLNDPSVLLKTMYAQWWDVFHESLGHNGKNLVGDLMNWRNVSAHRSPLSQEDVTHALGTMIRLLEQIATLQRTDEIVANLQQLKSRKQELELQRLGHLISARREKSAKASKPVIRSHDQQAIIASGIGEVDIADPVVLVRIDRSFKLGMTAEELYEETRGDWTIAPDKHLVQPRYAIAVAFRVIREVYEIHAWHPVHKSKWYKGGEGYGRQRFDGIIASDKAELISKSVERYIHPRSSSTITYVNC